MVNNIVPFINSELQKELKLVKAIRPKDLVYNFFRCIYMKRESLIGQANLSELDTYLEHLNIDLNIIEHRGYVPLFFAIDCYAPDIVKYLLDKGVNTDIKTQYGLTPLKLAQYKLQDALDMGRPSDGHICSCARQTIALLEGYLRGDN